MAGLRKRFDYSDETCQFKTAVTIIIVDGVVGLRLRVGMEAGLTT